MKMENEDEFLLTSPVEEQVSVIKKKRYPLVIFSLVILCIFLTIALIAVSLLWAGTTKSSRKNKRDNESLKHFFHVSDTHLDIYYDSHVSGEHWQGCRNKPRKAGGEIYKSNTTALFGRLKCDTPTDLLESLKKYIEEVKKGLVNDVEFILLTGDQAAHDYNFFDVDVSNSVLWSIANSTKYISDALPGVPVYMTLGNNDLKIEYLPPFVNDSEFYWKLYDIFEPYVFPTNSGAEVLSSKKKFKETFQFGGYYSINIDSGRTLLIVLNTNYWSAKAYMLNANVTIIGDVQLAWFSDQLNSARETKQKVLISGHIPPGIAAYDGISFWLSNYTNAYVRMVTGNFPDIIQAQLYGHIHSDRIKLQYLSDIDTSASSEPSFLLTAPSVTPVYGSNPAFRVYDYDSKSRALTDYEQYYLDLAASNVNKKAFWIKEYSFVDKYKVSLSLKGVEEIIDGFLEPLCPYWFEYSQHIKTKMGGILYNQRYHEYCVAKHVTMETYKNCSETFKDIGV